MTGRSVPEWIGASADTPVPPRIKARVFLAHAGICHVTKRKIRPPADKWECDHVIALANGGENREKNLAPALVDAHREKTKADVAEKAKTASMQQKHLGVKPKGRGFRKPPGARFDWSRGRYVREDG